MNIAVRAATDADEHSVIALWNACGLVVSHNDPSADFRFARAKENSDVLLGIDGNGHVVATIMVGHDGHRGWLYYVAVDPKQRKQGLGRQMVQAALTWLQERGVPKAQLMIRETNTEVAAFYERIGFEAIPRTVMEKWLPKPEPRN
jgi:ribosomal protein S18 acetylase RimI-like enzyme